MSYRLGPFTLTNGNPFVIDTQVNADLHLGLYLKNESQMLLSIDDYGDIEEEIMPGEHVFILANGKSAKMNVLPSFPGFPQTGVSNVLYVYLYLKGQHPPAIGNSKIAVRATSKSNPKFIYVEQNGNAGVSLSASLTPPTGKTAYLQGILATGGIGTAPNNCKITVANLAASIQFWAAENTTTPLYFREEFTQAFPSVSTDGTVQVTLNSGNGPHTLLIWGYNQ